MPTQRKFYDFACQLKMFLKYMYVIPLLLNPFTGNQKPYMATDNFDCVPVSKQQIESNNSSLNLTPCSASEILIDRVNFDDTTKSFPFSDAIVFHKYGTSDKVY